MCLVMMVLGFDEIWGTYIHLYAAGDGYFYLNESVAFVTFQLLSNFDELSMTI